ncbi:MAG: aminopeptidase [Methanomassiliicoccales archaeon]|nr:MAG: aminopeptidase [Methanomassiliicoccales archaeon]
MAKKTGKKSKLEEKLTRKQELVWDKLSEKDKKVVFEFSKGYKDFLARAKTEREAVTEIIKFAEKNGFKPIEKVKNPRAGTKVYITNRNKNIALIVLGTEPVENGVNIIASHIDAPRLDLKQNPLYEDDETKLALLKTHYYGGIKKYQWVNQPLAVHGFVVKGDGSSVEIVLGEDPNEPAFTVTDLEPHLYRKTQAKRKLPEGVKGEELNVLVGSIPIKDEEAKKKVKLWVLSHLNKKFGIVEEDFTTAELEIVPAGQPRDIGFDTSMVGAYGQDDRICAYASLTAIADIKKPKKTAIALFFDKEEIGSEGNTAVRSRFLETMIGELIELKNPDYRYSVLTKALSKSMALSSDVTGGVNPNYKDVHEMKNAPRIGYGLVITKFTGAGGKYSSNDANAEYIGELRRLFNKNKVPWQTGELGKVDEGGGGTIAKFLAEHNMEVVDCGPALLSLHAPFEIASKADLFATYRGYKVFYSS